jgi:flagellar assembly protein FliH
MADDLSPKEITTLVDRLLQSKDPAAVGLQKIVRDKRSEITQFPLHEVDFEDFSGERKGSLSDRDRVILQLEKQVSELKAQLETQRKQAENALQDAYGKGMTQGKEQGKQQGYTEAKEEFDERVAALQQKVHEVCTTVANEKLRLLQESENTCIRLSFAVAKKVVKQEVDENREIVCNVIKDALGYISSYDGLRVRVHPADADTLSGKQGFWHELTGDNDRVRVVEDETIQQGGAVVESHFGDVDARIGVQLSEINQLVEEKWQQMSDKDERDSTHPDT